MISSGSADKDIVHKIQQFLANEGYNIWFERNNNNEQAMEILADAIENSEFVIICMSDSYKRDNHCQAQAEHALISKRILVPLIVHSGYKPDGWLNALINNHISIDFGTSDFKTASELLLKEIKQRQHKKEIPDVKQTMSTSANIVHNSSVPLTVSDKPPISVESSVLSGPTSSIVPSLSSTNIDKQQPTSTRPISRSSTPATNTSGTFAVTDRQQQGSTYSTSRPPTPGAIYTVAPITVFKQQQVPIQLASTQTVVNSIPTSASIAVDQKPTASMQPVSRPATPAVKPSNMSTTIIQQQPPGQSVSRPSTPGSAAPIVANQQYQQQPPGQSVSRPSTPGSATPIVANQQYQQQPPGQSVSRPSTPGSAAVITSGIGDKQQQQQQQQQQTSNHSISRSATANPIYSVTPIVANQQYQQQQQQQMVLHPVERSSTPSSVSSDASVTTGTQRRQTPIHIISEPFTSGNVAPTTTIDINKQQQQTNVNTVLKSSTPSIVPSDASVNIEKNQKDQQQLTHSATQTPVINSVPSTATEQQSTQPVTRSSTSNASSSVTSVAVDKKQQQQSAQSNSKATASNSILSGVSTIDDKQQRQTSVHSTPKSSTPMSVDIENQQRRSSHSNSRPITPASGVRTTYVNIEKQQLPSRSNSQSTMPASGVPTTSIGIEKQQLPSRSNSQSTMPASSVPTTSIGIEKQQRRLSSQSNSRSTTPAILPNGSSTNLAQLTALQLNSREQTRLPTEYTNRKTHNSVYRTISINAWRNNDVLDFLFDTNLYTMMPLCESMSGRALVRLFRMCHRKPSRLYDQLNEELRVRFKGLTLPMGVYTQFLIEMDALVGPTLETFPSASEPKVVERVIFMSRPPQQQQSSPRPSIISSTRSKTATPVDSMSGTTTPRNPRITERAVYRPASNIGRPYNFIIESVEEPSVLLDQVQRYEKQLLLLDETARRHRELNSHR